MENILELFRFIDWFLVLPEEMATGFPEAVRQYDKGKKALYFNLDHQRRF
jgi:hypothetical protein